MAKILEYIFLVFSKNKNVGHVSYTVFPSISFLKDLSFFAHKQIPWY